MSPSEQFLQGDSLSRHKVGKCLGPKINAWKKYWKNTFSTLIHIRKANSK